MRDNIEKLSVSPNALVDRFVDSAKKFAAFPERSHSTSDIWADDMDLALPDRMLLLFEWWLLSPRVEFAREIQKILRAPAKQYQRWGDVRDLGSFLVQVLNSEISRFPRRHELVQSLENKIIECLESGYVDIEEL